MSRLDLAGKRFGRLAGIEDVGKTKKGERIWRCRCDCGEETEVRTDHLKSGHTRSCGCLKVEVATDNATTHGGHGTPEYNSWCSMKGRTMNPSNPAYDRYGGRGITVSKSWLSFEGFFADMGERPTLEYSLDRIDNDGSYCKENCRWATRCEQGHNKSNNALLTYAGQTKSIAEWAEGLAMKYSTLWHRLHRGWSVERALTEGVS